MHIPDSMIPLNQALIYWIITIIILAISLYKFSNSKDKEKRIVITSIMTVATVLISSLPIPSPIGIPIHFFVIPIIAILLGPNTGIIVGFLALLIQAILGLGGITTLGANTIVIGVCISFGTYLFYNIFNYLNNSLAIVLSTIIGIMIGTVGQIIILLISQNTTPETLLSSLLPFYLIISLIEAFINLVTIKTIRNIRPELLNIKKI